MKKMNPENETVMKILEAAAEIFSKSGYSNGTFREIAKKANVNNAAINYYFGDKEQLYAYVMDYWRDIAYKKYPLDDVINTSLPPEERLRIFIRQLCFSLMDLDGSPWFGKLITWESSVAPTEILDKMVQENLGPVTREVSNIIQEMLGEGFSKEETTYYTASIVGQCSYYYVCRHISKHLFGIGEVFSKSDIENIVQHVTDFSLNAIYAAKANRSA